MVQWVRFPGSVCTKREWEILISLCFFTRKIGRVCWLKSDRLMRQTWTRSTFCSLRIFLLPFIISEGCKHDASILADSGLVQDLQRFANSPAGNLFRLCGDPAYPQKIYLQTPFRNRALSAPMIAFNQFMSTVRESVEWLFNGIVNYFKFMDLKKESQNWFE